MARVGVNEYLNSMRNALFNISLIGIERVALSTTSSRRSYNNNDARANARA